MAVPRLHIDIRATRPEPDGEICIQCRHWHAADPANDIGFMFTPGVDRGPRPLVFNGWELIGACRTCLYGWTRNNAMHRLTADMVEEVLAHVDDARELEAVAVPAPAPTQVSA
jgi:hypothetical protein